MLLSLAPWLSDVTGFAVMSTWVSLRLQICTISSQHSFATSFFHQVWVYTCCVGAVIATKSVSNSSMNYYQPSSPLHYNLPAHSVPGLSPLRIAGIPLEYYSEPISEVSYNSPLRCQTCAGPCYNIRALGRFGVVRGRSTLG